MTEERSADKGASERRADGKDSELSVSGGEDFLEKVLSELF